MSVAMTNEERELLKNSDNTKMTLEECLRLLVDGNSTNSCYVFYNENFDYAIRIIGKLGLTKIKELDFNIEEIELLMSKYKI